MRLIFFKFNTLLKCIFLRSSLPLKTQIKWGIYHSHMQIHFLIKRFIFRKNKFVLNTRLKNFFNKNGFCFLGNSDSGLFEVASHIETLFAQQPEKKYRELPRAKDTMIANYVFKSLKKVESSIESIFKSHFQTYWIRVYKTIPGKNFPSTSFAWHQDADPRSLMKVFIYLNDVNVNNGAFHLFNRRVSHFLFCKGFISNTPYFRINSQKMISGKLLKLSQRIEGRAGKTFMFDNNLIHRGTFPKSGYRTVISIEIYPSREKLNYDNVLCSLEEKISDDFPSNPYKNKYKKLSK